MKKSKNISLFNIAVFIIINLYFRNIILFVLTIVYLLVKNYKELIIVLILLGLNIICSNYIIDPLPIGYVDYVSTKYIYVDKLLYRVKIETSDKYYIGQVVKTNGKSYKLIDKTKNKNNILFLNYDEPTIIVNNTALSKNISYLNNSNDNEKSVYKTLLFNEIDSNDFDYYFGYGFCLYYIIKLISKRNKYISLLIILIYSLFFGYDIKFGLLIIDFILSYFNINKKEKLGITGIIIALININLFNNYSILVSLLFNLISLTNFNNAYYISVFQTLLFGQVQLLSSYVYKYYLYLRVLAFCFCLISYVFPVTSKIVFIILKLMSYIFKIITFSIRGKINILLLLIINYIFKILKIKNILIKQFILIIVLVLNLSYPFTSVSFVDVGQGDSILISDSFNRNKILIDTGSSYNYYKLKKELFSKGIYKIDYLIITHDDADHNGNLNNLINDFKIVNIVNSPKTIELSDFYLKNIYIGQFDNDNENSLVYYTEISNIKFLFTGDITKNIERLIIKNNLVNDIDVLKISHHGSNTATSSYFVGKLLPNIAIISTNGQYGHPHQEVIDCLNSYLVDTYITCNEGTITFNLSRFFNFIKTDTNQFVIINS